MTPLLRRSALVVVLLSTACSGTTPTPRTSPSASPSPAPAPSAPARSAWPTYHGNASRTGDAGAAAAALTRPRVAWRARLDGAVYGQPVLAGSTVLVATEGDSVYALSPAGRVLWRRKLGRPAPLSTLPCGGIDPLGITGTPAYDPASGSVFVVAETRGGIHTLHALDARTGAPRWRRGLDVVPGRERRAQQQRGAVLLVRGRVVVAFGGLLGDCDDYVGYVVSVPATGRGPLSSYAVPTRREAGIWAPPGPVVGPTGAVLVSTGNGAATGGPWDGSDSVLALDPVTLHRRAFFAPRTWPQDNAADLDLGSLSPVPVGARVVAAGKRGTVYLLPASLGGIGGELASLEGCEAYGGAAVRGTTVLLPCTTGVRALEVRGDALSWRWQAQDVPGSPVLAGRLAYALAPKDGVLHVLSLVDGRRLASVRVGTATRFASPTVAEGGRMLLVPTVDGVTAVR